ncbi:MAG: purine-binding chemotaxis protein CheW [Chroococcidiopsidaceae cyanobacterium CP_BM_RX_35]|nr:purine-binding chemotaxis protein CheW [Chroococcidiopsidaceae cyanobacterium CP_BM_RX_35]
MTGNPDLLTNSSRGQAPEFQELERPEGELYLRFYISSEDYQEFALSATGIREVIATPLDRITPIPNASPLLLGTINLRGRVVWVADLGQLLGKPTALNTERAEIPVIAIEDRDTMLGLAVDQIVGMGWLDLERVQAAATEVPDSMALFLRGEWLLDEKNNQRIRLLDQTAILHSGRWIA